MIAFALAGQDPYLTMGVALYGLGVIGIVSLQALASFAVIRYFARNRTGESRLATVVAPLLGGAGLTAGVALMATNYGTLTGSTVRLDQRAAVAAGRGRRHRRGRRDRSRDCQGDRPGRHRRRDGLNPSLEREITMTTVDVVVVGAGFAGLTAARRLQQEGRSVVVLEARDRVGGRILNHTFADGTIVELGGQWVGPTQDRVLALADELGVGTFPSYEEGDNLLGVDGGARRWADETFGLDEEALIDVAETQAALEAMAATVPLDAPWDAPDARELDAQTVESWLVANMKTETGLRFWRTLIPAIFSADTDQMSLLHFLFYVHSGGMIDMLVATGGGAQDSRVVGGSQTIALRMAEELGKAVRFDCPVHLIHQDAARRRGRPRAGQRARRARHRRPAAGARGPHPLQPRAAGPA